MKPSSFALSSGDGGKLRTLLHGLRATSGNAIPLTQIAKQLGEGEPELAKMLLGKGRLAKRLVDLGLCARTADGQMVTLRE